MSGSVVPQKSGSASMTQGLATREGNEGPTL